MIYALNPNLAQRTLHQRTLIHLLGILGFAILTAIAAQISIPRAPVPITMQVLAVLVAGLTLGARDGAASQVVYLLGIAAGLPIAANGVGSAALAGPTAGYLYAFPLAAGLVGFCATRHKIVINRERRPIRLTIEPVAVRQNVFVRWGASMLGVILIYIIGTAYLKAYLGISWQTAWDNGVQPFLLIDMGKALLAAASGEGLRQWWLRQYPGQLD